MIDREKLLTALKLVEPALAKKDLIEEFTYIWFDGKYITASNDNGLGIIVPFKCNLHGGLPGDALIGLLSNSKMQDISVTGTEGEEIKLKAGRAKATFGTLPLERMMAEPPDVKKAKFVIMKKELAEALENVLPFIGNPNSEMPEQTGVTIFPGKKHLRIMVTDDDTMAEAACPIGNYALEKRITLSAPFVQQLVVAAKGEDEWEFAVYKGIAIARSAKMMVYDKLVEIENPTDLAALMDKNIKTAKFGEIPARLKLALARAFAWLSAAKEQYVTFRVANNVLALKTSSNFGDLSDRMDWQAEDVEVKLSPALIKRALKMCTEMSLSERHMLMSSADNSFVYVIASFE